MRIVFQDSEKTWIECTPEDIDYLISCHLNNRVLYDCFEWHKRRSSRLKFVEPSSAFDKALFAMIRPFLREDAREH